MRALATEEEKRWIHSILSRRVRMDKMVKWGGSFILFLTAVISLFVLQSGDLGGDGLVFLLLIFVNILMLPFLLFRKVRRVPRLDDTTLIIEESKKQSRFVSFKNHKGMVHSFFKVGGDWVELPSHWLAHIEKNPISKEETCRTILTTWEEEKTFTGRNKASDDISLINNTPLFLSGFGSLSIRREEEAGIYIQKNTEKLKHNLIISAVLFFPLIMITPIYMESFEFPNNHFSNIENHKPIKVSEVADLPIGFYQITLKNTRHFHKPYLKDNWNEPLEFIADSELLSQSGILLKRKYSYANNKKIYEKLLQTASQGQSGYLMRDEDTLRKLHYSNLCQSSWEDIRESCSAYFGLEVLDTTGVLEKREKEWALWLPKRLSEELSYYYWSWFNLVFNVLLVLGFIFYLGRALFYMKKLHKDKKAFQKLMSLY